MSQNLTLNYFITEKNLVLKLDNRTELLINLKKMRLSCPCAHCKGEKDVFGNVYKNENKNPLTPQAFMVAAIKSVGNYAIRVFWEDQHTNGIYTFDFLKSLSE